jgi:protein-L-isoaspartate(D-aspartate) O-methyltransferase
VPHRNWQQANAAFPDRAAAERQFTSQVGPVLRDAEAGGLILSWFFLRKQQWRLRWLPASPAASAAFLTALTRDTPSLTWTSVTCEFEPLALGGNSGMTAACDLFHTDSHHLLRWLGNPLRPLGQRETSVLLCGALLRGAGLDWFEQGDVWARVAALRPHQMTIPGVPGQADSLRDAMRTLMTADSHALCDPAQAGPLPGYGKWVTAFDRAGQTLAELHHNGQLARGLRAVLAHHFIFHFNRAGFSGTEQATMAALACSVVFHDDPHDGRNLGRRGQQTRRADSADPPPS